MHLFSFRLGIFIFFRMLRQIFLSCLASFSAFSCPDEKKSAAFFHPDHPFSEIFSLRRNNFSCLFPTGERNFSPSFHHFRTSSGTSRLENPHFPAHFCTNQTRAHLHARNNIEYPSRLPFPHSGKYAVKHT